MAAAGDALHCLEGHHGTVASNGQRVQYSQPGEADLFASARGGVQGACCSRHLCCSPAPHSHNHSQFPPLQNMSIPLPQQILSDGLEEGQAGWLPSCIRFYASMKPARSLRSHRDPRAACPISHPYSNLTLYSHPPKPADERCWHGFLVAPLLTQGCSTMSI